MSELVPLLNGADSEHLIEVVRLASLVCSSDIVFISFLSQIESLQRGLTTSSTVSDRETKQQKSHAADENFSSAPENCSPNTVPSSAQNEDGHFAGLKAEAEFDLMEVLSRAYIELVGKQVSVLTLLETQ